MNLASKNVCRPLPPHREWTAVDLDPTNANKSYLPDHSVVLQQTRPFEDMSHLISSGRFWRQAEQISVGWLCQDVKGNIGAKSLHNNPTLEQILVDVLRWVYRQQMRPGVIVLVARSAPTSHQIEKRLHTMSAALRGDRWTQVRLCVITSCDLLYIRDPDSQ